MPRAQPLAAAALLALACSGGDAGSGPRADPKETASPAGSDAERASGRRGDRHARAAARHPRTVKRTDGRVLRASDRLVVIRRRDERDLALRVGPRTSVTVNGAASRAAALREGAEVHAAYRWAEGGRPTAVSIDAIGPR